MAEKGKGSEVQRDSGRLTQKAIAEALGISPSAVSIVMRNPGTSRASEETKQRILAMLKRNPGSGRHASDGDTILVINKPERNVYYFQSKMLHDFREACGALGVAPAESDVHLYAHGEDDAGDWDAVDGILSRWQRLKRRASAFVVYNDNLAVKFYQVARVRSIRIPEDVSLVGYDNEPVCEHLLPKLTSVSPAFFDLGRMAVDLLMSRKEPASDVPGRKIICPVKLVVRESVSRKQGIRAAVCDKAVSSAPKA